MIHYRQDPWLGFFIVLQPHGSVLLCAVPRAVLAGLLTWLLMAYGVDVKVAGGGVMWSPTLFNFFLSLAALVLAFHTNQAYQRFWEARSQVQCMASWWADAASSSVAMDELCGILPGNVARGAEWRAHLLHLLSLLHAVSIQYLLHNDAEHTHLEVLGGMDNFEAKLLSLTNDQTYLVMHWVVQELMRRVVVDAGLPVPHPFVSRVQQQLSNGMLAFNSACKIEDTPFPFPYVQLVQLMDWFMTVACPVVIASWTTHIPFAIILSIVSVGSFHATFAAACAMESPFGRQSNDLPLVELHRDFVKRLKSIVDTHVASCLNQMILKVEMEATAREEELPPQTSRPLTKLVLKFHQLAGGADYNSRPSLHPETVLHLSSGKAVQQPLLPPRKRGQQQQQHHWPLSYAYRMPLPSKLLSRRRGARRARKGGAAEEEEAGGRSAVAAAGGYGGAGIYSPGRRGRRLLRPHTRRSSGRPQPHRQQEKWQQGWGSHSSGSSESEDDSKRRADSKESAAGDIAAAALAGGAAGGRRAEEEMGEGSKVEGDSFADRAAAAYAQKRPTASGSSLGVLRVALPSTAAAALPPRPAALVVPAPAAASSAPWTAPRPAQGAAAAATSEVVAGATREAVAAARGEAAAAATGEAAARGEAAAAARGEAAAGGKTEERRTGRATAAAAAAAPSFLSPGRIDSETGETRRGGRTHGDSLHDLLAVSVDSKRESLLAAAAARAASASGAGAAPSAVGGTAGASAEAAEAAEKVEAVRGAAEERAVDVGKERVGGGEAAATHVPLPAVAAGSSSAASAAAAPGVTAAGDGGGPAAPAGGGVSSASSVVGAGPTAAADETNVEMLCELGPLSRGLSRRLDGRSSTRRRSLLRTVGDMISRQQQHPTKGAAPATETATAAGTTGTAAGDEEEEVARRGGGGVKTAAAGAAETSEAASYAPETGTLTEREKKPLSRRPSSGAASFSSSVGLAAASAAGAPSSFAERQKVSPRVDGAPPTTAAAGGGAAAAEARFSFMKKFETSSRRHESRPGPATQEEERSHHRAASKRTLLVYDPTTSPAALMEEGAPPAGRAAAKSGGSERGGASREDHPAEAAEEALRAPVSHRPTFISSEEPLPAAPVRRIGAPPLSSPSPLNIAARMFTSKSHRDND